jgi:hypothetical protein
MNLVSLVVMKNSSASQNGFVDVMISSVKKKFFKFGEMCFESKKSGEVSEKFSFETWKCFSLENIGLCMNFFLNGC